MASRFKRGDVWYIKTKGPDGKWKNISCGKNASSTDAETIRKKYDSIELNRRHDAVVRIVDADLLEQLKIYRRQEIPRSRTGRPKSRKGITRYEAIIDNFMNWLTDQGFKKYSDITTDRIKLFFDFLLFEKKRSASTITKHRQILINFYDWSIERHYCQRSPMDVIRNPKRVSKPPYFYSDQQLQAIFNDAKRPYDDIFRFLYLTGLRIGELGNAEWVHFIEHTKSLRIPVMEGNKTKREEMVHLNADALKIIEHQRGWAKEIGTPDALRYIFTNLHGLKLDDANIYRHHKVVSEHLKLLEGSPHTLRHTCASHLVIKGVSLYVVKDILRHASFRETEIYAHLSKDAVRDAVEKLTVFSTTPEPPKDKT